tara:strand:- start:3380 stop:4267 length:888 start_codon:yes stop_codon:yes gene_type:complete
MRKSVNNFVCIGAIHYDYLLNLKKNIIKNRTNPIIHNKRIGGVAYNVAEILSIFEKVQFYSLKINNELKKSITNKILLKNINNKKLNRYYIAISDKNNNFLLGLANTNVYEKNQNLKIPKIINKIIIFDLNFSKNFLEKAIKKLSFKNKIIVCATSIHKVNKIKKILKYIDILFLNKSELIQLTNTKDIMRGIKKIQSKNNKIKIISTNSKNHVIYANNVKIFKIKPPKIKIKNENGAGDALAAMMIFLFSKEYDEKIILKYAVACGSYYAKGKKLNIKKDLIKVKNLSKKVILN